MQSCQSIPETFRQAAGALCPRIRDLLLRLPAETCAQVSEIRLRVGQPVALWSGRGTCFVREGAATRKAERGVRVQKADLQESFRSICRNSIYSYQEEISEGYVTLNGGHRVGLGGTAVLHDGRITGMREITSLNLRVARQMNGCADSLLRRLPGLRGGLLLAGPPASGKTTLLRDLARQLSGGGAGVPHKVTVVDERGEICGASQGIYGCDLGPCCDVLNGFPKAEGMLLAIRSLSPEYLICDELGTQQEAQALIQSVNAGACVVASVHAGSFQELCARPQARALLQSGAFAYAALLSGGAPGCVTGIRKVGELLAQDAGGAVSAVCGHSGGVPAVPCSA